MNVNWNALGYGVVGGLIAIAIATRFSVPFVAPAEAGPKGTLAVVP